MKTRLVVSSMTVFCLALVVQTSAFGGNISNTGLLAEYAYETSGGLAVSDGQSAAGAQVDDTGLNAAGPNHATGSPLVQSANLLTYSTDVTGTGGVGSGRALSFPLPQSNSNYVSVPIPQGSDLDNIGSGDFYIQAYIKTTDTDRANIFASYSGSNPVTAFNLELHTSNRVRIYMQNGTSVDQINSTAPGVTYADNEWHKIIAVRDSGTLTLTIDGVTVGAPIASTVGFEQTNSEFRIGQDNRASSTPKYTGLLDDVILTRSNNSLFSRVAVYDFDTAGGVDTVDGQSAVGTIDDTGGNAGGPFDGIAAGLPPSKPEYSADVPAALIGSSTHSLEFEEGNSAAEEATFPVTPEVASVSMGDFTVETWFKTSDVNRSGLVSGWANGTDRAFGLELHTSNRVRFFIEGGPNFGNGDLNTTPPFDTRDGQWHHAVARREGTEQTVWVDGQLTGTREDPGGDFEVEVALMRLGNDNRAAGLPFDGLLDNSRLWSRALSEAEIVSLAEGGVPVPEPSTLALALMALTGLVAGSRRRRKN